ncbi:hypothetical protein MYX82_13845 [Acidobacteria bacterium AH-259-D05]|nr:hypothetical protein [Acidobacteria bacterium AH-259-D05]
MAGKYCLEDVTKSYNWLGHKTWTELNAFHPNYTPGKENFEWNLEQKTFPRIWYGRSEKEVVNFVQRYVQERTVCYGINPRTRIFKNKREYARCALDKEIEISQSILFDFDFESGKVTKNQVAALETFLKKTDEYFFDLSLKTPVRAFTGKGYHLLFAYPEIEVKEHPDISEKSKEFRDEFNDEYRRDLENLEVRLDKTQDLRRMVRIYGTAKPDVGIVSCFYGGERVEDESLRNYLLSLKTRERCLGSLVLNTGSKLPDWFQKLLERDRDLRELWSGKGKPQNTDRTRSGFDYSVVRRLLWLGYKNIDELGTVLALRPEGGVKKSGKGEQYITRTIGNALLK